MTWILRNDENETGGHKCLRPDVFECGFGSVWQCDECGRPWVVIGTSTEEDNKPEQRAWFAMTHPVSIAGSV